MNCSRLKDYIFDLTKLFMFFSYSQKMTLWLYAPSTILHLCIVFFFVYPVQVSVQSKGSERSCICVLEIMYLCVRGHVFVCQTSCICVLGVAILTLSKICSIGNVPTVCYFLLCFSLHNYYLIVVIFRLSHYLFCIKIQSLINSDD